MESTHTVIGDLDIRPVVRVSADTSVLEAATLLAETGAETLVVDTEPLSEMTERDLIAALGNGVGVETPLSEISRPAPVFVQRETRAEDAVTIMVVTGRRSLVVVDGGRPLGVITLPCVVTVLWSGTSWMGALRGVLHLEGRM